LKVIIPAGHIFQHCYSKCGIPAINVWSLEQIHGLFRAAQKAKAPFIVQFTPVAKNYAHPDMLMAMVQAAAKIYSDTVFAIHLDHGDRMQALQAIDAGGYTSVMIDVSYKPHEINVKLTREVVQKAHAKNMEAFEKFNIEKKKLLKAVGKADEIKYFTDEKR
jgi:fructose-bisphosphate aldolase class II